VIAWALMLVAVLVLAVFALAFLQRSLELANALLRIHAVVCVGRAAENAPRVLESVADVVEAELPVHFRAHPAQRFRGGSR
jgi:hypothetical protein